MQQLLLSLCADQVPILFLITILLGKIAGSRPSAKQSGGTWIFVGILIMFHCWSVLIHMLPIT
jgi:hypothetical protein